MLGKAGEKGQKRRLKDAKNGKVSWETSPEIKRHMDKQVMAAIVKRKEVMGKMQNLSMGFTEEEEKMLRRSYDDEKLDFSEKDMMEALGETMNEAGTEGTENDGAAVAAGHGQETEARARTEMGAEGRLESVLEAERAPADEQKTK